MTTHFWLSAESVPLTLEQIASMTDEQARLFLAELRWGEFMRRFLQHVLLT